MLSRSSQNPFEQLRLPSETSDRDVVARGRELAQEASPSERISIREAVEAIITDPLRRIELELLTFAGADYTEDDAWEQIGLRFQGQPFAPDQLAVLASALSGAPGEDPAQSGDLISALAELIGGERP